MNVSESREPSLLVDGGKFMHAIVFLICRILNNYGVYIAAIVGSICLIGWLYSKAMAFQASNAYCVELKDVFLRVYNAVVNSMQSVVWLVKCGVWNAIGAVLKFLDATWRFFVLVLAIPCLFIMCIVSCFTTKYNVPAGKTAFFTPEFKSECENLGLSPVSPPTSPRGPVQKIQQKRSLPTWPPRGNRGGKFTLASPATAVTAPASPATAVTAPASPATAVAAPALAPTDPTDASATAHVTYYQSIDGFKIAAEQYEAIRNHVSDFTQVVSAETENTTSPDVIGFQYRNVFIPMQLFEDVTKHRDIAGFILKKARTG